MISEPELRAYRPPDDELGLRRAIRGAHQANEGGAIEPALFELGCVRSEFFHVGLDELPRDPGIRAESHLVPTPCPYRLGQDPGQRLSEYVLGLRTTDLVVPRQAAM